MLLNAFFIRHPVDFFTEVDESRTLFTANSLLSQPNGFLYERHGSSDSVTAQGCMSEISNYTTGSMKLSRFEIE